MVLERGRVAEFEPPLQLLRRPTSLFYALCEKSGALSELLAVAEEEEARRSGAAAAAATNGGGGGGGHGNGAGDGGAGSDPQQ
jgi:hypothetical protein